MNRTVEAKKRSTLLFVLDECEGWSCTIRTFSQSFSIGYCTSSCIPEWQLVIENFCNKKKSTSVIFTFGFLRFGLRCGRILSSSSFLFLAISWFRKFSQFLWRSFCFHWGTGHPSICIWLLSRSWARLQSFGWFWVLFGWGFLNDFIFSRSFVRRNWNLPVFKLIDPFLGRCLTDFIFQTSEKSLWQIFSEVFPSFDGIENQIFVDWHVKLRGNARH